MMFYIFGSDKKSNFTVKRNKALYYSSDFECAYNKYERYIDEVKRRNLYLVADFECHKSSYFKASSVKDHEKEGAPLPFFVIGSWKFGSEDKGLNDHTKIIIKGFERDFNNNYFAMKIFINHLKEKEPVEFRIIYKEYDTVFKQFLHYNRLIARTNDMINTPSCEIRKFKLYESTWAFIPIQRRPFTMITLPNKNGESVTDTTDSDNISFVGIRQGKFVG